MSAVVCDLAAGMRGPGSHWTDDDAIYFSGSDGIFVVPGGKAILFTSVVGDLWDTAKIVMLALDAGTPAGAPRRDLITGGADARYVDSGHLVYMKSGTLMGVPFDAASRQLTGAPVPLIENVMHAVNAPNFADETGAGRFAVSRSGTLLRA